MSGPAPGERPLADRLDTFWQGRVPAAAEDDGEHPTALDELGPSGITLGGRSPGGRSLDAALAAAYRRFTGAG
ncbi:hypothetical protein [Kitasatospora sp. NBC_00458]|uniref:hypothetical protein n=1 Tax=Kitasatospora sp. NBC_00458 TaxID=2903568 RepID=UPI002E174E14